MSCGIALLIVELLLLILVRVVISLGCDGGRGESLEVATRLGTRSRKHHSIIVNVDQLLVVLTVLDRLVRKLDRGVVRQLLNGVLVSRLSLVVINITLVIADLDEPVGLDRGLAMDVLQALLLLLLSLESRLALVLARMHNLLINQGDEVINGRAGLGVNGNSIASSVVLEDDCGLLCGAGLDGGLGEGTSRALLLLLSLSVVAESGLGGLVARVSSGSGDGTDRLELGAVDDDLGGGSSLDVVLLVLEGLNAGVAHDTGRDGGLAAILEGILARTIGRQGARGVADIAKGGPLGRGVESTSHSHLFDVAHRLVALVGWLLDVLRGRRSCKGAQRSLGLFRRIGLAWSLCRNPAMR